LKSWSAQSYPHSRCFETGGYLEKLISDLRAKQAEIFALETRVAELEAENRRLWTAMRATGVLLRKFLPEDE
jgi:hypothetical protein